MATASLRLFVSLFRRLLFGILVLAASRHEHWLAVTRGSILVHFSWYSSCSQLVCAAIVAAPLLSCVVCDVSAFLTFIAAVSNKARPYFYPAASPRRTGEGAAKDVCPRAPAPAGTTLRDEELMASLRRGPEHVRCSSSRCRLPACTRAAASVEA